VGKINGIALTAAGAGALFAYTAIRGKSITASVQALVQGKSPAALPAANQITDTTAQLASTTPGGASSPSSSSGGGSQVANTGSNESILKATAATFGWTGAEWTALYNVEMAEAGFSLTATNPSSGAYGMAQFINGPSEYAQYGGNSTTAAGQSIAMCNYIKGRYRTPSAAWAHEQAYHWY
jgi:hypothetical protein